MNASEEEFIPEDEAEEGPGLVKRLREKLQRAVEEKQEYLEGWQRARADFANYKKEEASLHADRHDRIKAELIEAMLPALDALELALKHHPEDTNLAMLQRQFDDALKRASIERFGTVGETFDPRTHEALAMQGQEHTVVSVERSGYRVGDTIIRPAQVII